MAARRPAREMGGTGGRGVSKRSIFKIIIDNYLAGETGGSIGSRLASIIDSLLWAGFNR